MDYPYIPPDFLQGQSADDIHRRMIEELPPGYDKSENNIPWDLTRPSALVKSEYVEFDLNETIKLMFPQWSYDQWLDEHGRMVNITRRTANKASGVLSVTGIIGTVVPTGYEFATPANLTASVIFASLTEVVLDGTLDATGKVTVDIPIQALEGGTDGNVPEDAIKLMVKPLSGIAYVTNHAPITGGTSEESDALLRERVLDAMRNGTSFVGNNADYVRWGKEVSAVGQVIVDPEWNDPSLPAVFHYTDEHGNERCAGAVRLIIIDANGIPANQQILDAVYSHIMGTGDTDITRLAPIGAHLTVIAPSGINIDIAATLILKDDEDIGTVTERFKTNIAAYWLEVAQEAQNDDETHIGYLRWTQVGAVLDKTPGVLDYSGLTVNGGTDNIAISQAQYPVTGEVTFNA